MRLLLWLLLCAHGSLLQMRKRLNEVKLSAALGVEPKGGEKSKEVVKAVKVAKLVKKEGGKSRKHEKPDKFKTPEELVAKIECKPECIAGRGICNDGVCFCRTPYEGKKCEREVNTEMRFGYPIFVCNVIVAFMFGIALAAFCHSFTSSKPVQLIGPPAQRRETWIPREREEKG